METILISGGTGMIGKALTDLLVGKGYKVIVLTRSARPAAGGVSYVIWNVEKGQIDAGAISAADHIIHLAGENIAEKRWTDKRKKEIVDSRVNAGRLLVKALGDIPNQVKTVVSASATGWYGPDKPAMKRGFIESDPSHTDFLGETCRMWEESISGVTALGKRLVILRTGIVLAGEGGALPQYLLPMKFGVAGILNGGEQNISWIHLDDICRMYEAAIENTNMSGAYNATAPEIVSNKKLTLDLAKARAKPFIPVHVPVFALQVYLGELKEEVLKSTTVDDSKVRKAGFTFLFPSLKAALSDLVKK